VHGRRKAMKHAAEASRNVDATVEVVRDDGRLTFIYWGGMLQGCVDRR
jgi:hypothetical protein